jgi:hypothetical protein
MAAEEYKVPAGLSKADRFDPAVTKVGRQFMRMLFGDPRKLVEIAAPDFIGWEYAQDVSESRIIVNGARGLIAYRERFGSYVDDKFVGPTLMSNRQIAVPARRTFVIPGTEGRRYNFGILFKSTFRLLGDGLPEDMPPVSLIMEEHVDVGPGPEGDLMVLGRMYLPYDEQGPIGPGTNHPHTDQEGLVARQIEHFRNRQEPLLLPTAQQVYRQAYPDVIV